MVVEYDDERPDPIIAIIGFSQSGCLMKNPCSQNIGDSEICLNFKNGYGQRLLDC